MKKRILSLVLAVLMLAAIVPTASAKTTPAGQTVGTVLFYTTNDVGEEILVSHVAVSEMEADMAAGKIDDTLHNYSLLDRFVTTLHQEAQGFTVPEYVAYAQSKSEVAELRALPLSFSGDSVISFWEIDQTGFDDMDSYTYADLYGTPRYNFPLLYEYWDYTKQDYYDPAGKMSRAEVIDHIFKNAVPEVFILSVRAYSQRYMVTSEKYGIDFNMEGYWNSLGLLDNQRTMRVMKPMTRDELYSKTPTAADTRYWTANIRLAPENAPSIKPLGKVAAPTATMTEDATNYYIRFESATDGATILYNHNYISPSYTPTSLYGDGAVVVPKEHFKGGTVTMTARAVKDGYTDAGVVTLTLKATGTEESTDAVPTSQWSDVADDAWYLDAVSYVMERGLFDAPNGKFSPEAATTREMFAVALYRHAGRPEVTDFVNFADVTTGTPLSAAVSWAFNAGVINGVGDNRFAPEAQITREQLATMLYRYATYRMEDISVRGDLSAFSDSASVSSWATTEMAWANGMKIINGMGDGRIAPQGTATRAQVAQMLKNYAGA